MLRSILVGFFYLTQGLIMMRITDILLTLTDELTELSRFELLPDEHRKRYQSPLLLVKAINRADRTLCSDYKQTGVLPIALSAGQTELNLHNLNENPSPLYTSFSNEPSIPGYGQSVADWIEHITYLSIETLVDSSIPIIALQGDRSTPERHYTLTGNSGTGRFPSEDWATFDSSTGRLRFNTAPGECIALIHTQILPRLLDHTELAGAETDYAICAPADFEAWLLSEALYRLFPYAISKQLGLRERVADERTRALSNRPSDPPRVYIPEDQYF